MAVSIDQQFVEYIVKSLVGKPEAVKVDRRIDEKGVLLELTVDPEDLGRVIGKKGSTAQSLRTLLRALGTKNDARYNLKIIDTGPPPERREESAAVSAGEKPRLEKEPALQTQTEPAGAAAESSVQPAHTASEVDAAEDEDLEKIEAKTKDTSDVISRTRKELAELDDLDV